MLQHNFNSAMERMVTVTNPTEKVLSYPWDSEIYTFNPGASEKVPFWLGQHLFKHLSKLGLLMDETEKVACGTCGKEFDTKRELGAHSLVHSKGK